MRAQGSTWPERFLPQAPVGATLVLGLYVGGLISREKIDEVLNDGFEFVSMARALLNDPSFVNKMKEDEHARCDCGHSNYCIARMYSIEMACHKHIQNLPKSIVKEIEKLEYK